MREMKRMPHESKFLQKNHFNVIKIIDLKKSKNNWLSNMLTTATIILDY